MTWFSLRHQRSVWGFCTALAGLAACSDDGLTRDEDAVGGMNTTSGGGGAQDSAATGAEGGEAPGGESEGDPASTTSPPDQGETGGDTSSGDTGEPTLVCESPSQCTLVDDCCRCEAAFVGAEPPACQIETCEATVCEQYGLQDQPLACRNGTCELERVNCSGVPACDEPAPDCAAGTVPRVLDGCWGACIPAVFCDAVPDCSACTAEQACVRHEVGTDVSYTCESLPPACGGVASCDCLPDICERPTACVDEADAVACTCTTCSSSQP